LRWLHGGKGGQLLQLLLADDDVAEDSGGDQEHIQAEPKMCNETDFSVPLTPLNQLVPTTTGRQG